MNKKSTHFEKELHEIKACSRCMEDKVIHIDFYMCRGKYRSECKKCTIKRNVIYQRKAQSWRNRDTNCEHLKKYMVDYYARNKQKFAEYRKRFKERNPDYYKEYARRKKNEKMD